MNQELKGIDLAKTIAHEAVREGFVSAEGSSIVVYEESLPYFLAAVGKLIGSVDKVMEVFSEEPELMAAYFTLWVGAIYGTDGTILSEKQSNTAIH